MTFNRAQLEKLHRLAQAEQGRRSLRYFAEQVWPIVEPARPFIPNWHIDAICDHLQAVSEGDIHRLLVTIPPGHAKSLLVSVAWPAWQWARPKPTKMCGPDGPGARGIYCSYDVELAIRDSRRCRDLMMSPWYQRVFQPTWRFTGDQNLKSWFENDQKGFRIALGVKKGTGYRGDLVVCDDPLNAHEQANDRALDDVIFWWDQVMSSRVNDPATGAFVIIMQRLSEKDLAGHITKADYPLHYEHLNLPSEFEPERRAHTVVLDPNTGKAWQDPRTQEGELLFEKLFPKEVLVQAKAQLLPQGYAAQHQQRPAPAGGNVYKRWWWRFWIPENRGKWSVIRFRDEEGNEHECPNVSLPAYVDEMVLSVDCSFKNEKGSDFVAAVVLGRLNAMCFCWTKCMGE